MFLTIGQVKSDNQAPYWKVYLTPEETELYMKNATYRQVVSSAWLAIAEDSNLIIHVYSMGTDKRFMLVTPNDENPCSGECDECPFDSGEDCDNDRSKAN